MCVAANLQLEYAGVIWIGLIQPRFWSLRVGCGAQVKLPKAAVGALVRLQLG